MTISKRTLIKWRKEALKARAESKNTTSVYDGTTASAFAEKYLLEVGKVLDLTQELIDQELLKETKNG